MRNRASVSFSASVIPFAGVRGETPVLENLVRHRPLFRGKTEVEPRAGLEHHTSLYAVTPATNSDERSHEAKNLELLLKLGSVPDFAMLGFQILPAPFNGVDLLHHFTTDGFGRIAHLFPFQS